MAPVREASIYESHMLKLVTYIMMALSCCALCIGVPPQHEVEGRQASTKVKTVAYCDLIRKYKSYDGKIIRVKALFYAGENWGVVDRACDVDPQKRDMAVSFICKDEADCRELWEPLERIIPWDKKREPPPGVADVVVVGRFHGPRPGGYGHIGAWAYMLEVMRIESASPASLGNGNEP